MYPSKCLVLPAIFQASNTDFWKSFAVCNNLYYFWQSHSCLKFNYGNTANNSLTIFQAEKRIIYGCKYPGRFTYHSHDFLPPFNHTRARLILAIFQTRYSHAVYFSFAFYVKPSKNKKGRKLFQACDQVAKFVESNYTQPFSCVPKTLYR